LFAAGLGLQSGETRRRDEAAPRPKGAAERRLLGQGSARVLKVL
jgi:hypothetical protein